MARILSTPTMITVQSAGFNPPYQTPSMPATSGTANKRELIVSGSMRFAVDGKPAHMTNFNWQFGAWCVLSGGAFSTDLKPQGAYVMGGTGGHNAPEFYGFQYFDFETGRWSAYVHGKDKDGQDAPLNGLPWQDDPPSPIGIFRDPSISPQHDNLHMVGGQGTNPPGEWNEMPPGDHTYSIQYVPPRSKTGGVSCLIRPVSAAIGSASVLSSSRPFKLRLEGSQIGRWSYAGNRGVADGAFSMVAMTEQVGVYAAELDRIYYPINLVNTGKIPYFNFVTGTWGRETSIASAPPSTWGVNNPRMGFYDHAKQLLVLIGGTSLSGEIPRIAYLKMNESPKVWRQGTYTGPHHPGDYPSTDGGRTPFKARLVQYPVADGGDGCWYGFWGRGVKGTNDNRSQPSMKAVYQYLWKIKVPTDPVTQPFEFSFVPVTDEENKGGLTAHLTTDWTGAQDIHFTRFFYVPSLRCFAWIPRPDTPVELIKVKA